MAALREFEYLKKVKGSSIYDAISQNVLPAKTAQQLETRAKALRCSKIHDRCDVRNALIQNKMPDVTVDVEALKKGVELKPLVNHTKLPRWAQIYFKISVNTKFGLRK